MVLAFTGWKPWVPLHTHSTQQNSTVEDHLALCNDAEGKGYWIRYVFSMIDSKDKVRK